MQYSQTVGVSIIVVDLLTCVYCMAYLIVSNNIYKKLPMPSVRGKGQINLLGGGGSNAPSAPPRCYGPVELTYFYDYYCSTCAILVKG